jgi:hypothetical protein
MQLGIVKEKRECNNEKKKKRGKNAIKSSTMW